ncbi:hypothetical protein CRM22_005099 [Opisthorchis felineus]|uniref:Amiloride-sensitive sodium channel n=1 Tax=Opisthorchis felineus TaxID=147828 RepID=A0A4S2LSS8_OPIFE|nr:hypothetical protein CRM22_005099 [Opisthorchis felineus]
MKSSDEAMDNHQLVTVSSNENEETVSKGITTNNTALDSSHPNDDSFLPTDLVNCNDPEVASTITAPRKPRTFGEISSIRGVQNISRAETPFIRSLWILFVITMTSLLTIFSSFLIRDYLLYETNWHTRTLRDDKTAFPSITLCAHNPFSLEANRFWREGSTPNPKQINSRFTEIATEVLRQRNVAFSINLLLLDSIETFYTNLDPKVRYNIGHKMEMFPHCMVTSESAHIVAEKCKLELDTELHLHRISHPKYFNCWTIEGKALEATKEITRLIMLIQLVPSKKINEANLSFIMDTFTRGEGVISVVHEPGTYPEIEKHGINIQPNRMNQIIYKPVLWNRLATPKAPCSDHPPPISDLGVNYTYTQGQCLNTVLQEQLLARCGCLNTEYPRPASTDFPVNPTPYCTSLNESLTNPEMASKLIERFQCIGEVMDRLKEIKEEAARQGRCLPRCSYFTYENRLSVTLWDPNAHNLAAYTERYRKLDGLLKAHSSMNLTTSFVSYWNASIQQFSSLDLESHNQPERFAEYSQFVDGSVTYISLTRQEFETTVMDERLVFDVYILISRIGGLCSLCIGLTMAFFIEVVEYAYMRLLYNRMSEQSRKWGFRTPAHVTQTNVPSAEFSNIDGSRTVLRRTRRKRYRRCCCHRPWPKSSSV